MGDAITNPLTPTTAELVRMLLEEETRRTLRRLTDEEFDERGLDAWDVDGGAQLPYDEEK